jgi:CBS-domain-containing membrane protein
MNVAFFLVPKNEVAWIPMSATLGEANAQFEQTGYSALPLLDDEGRYAGTITEGDLLREVMRVPEREPSATQQLTIRQLQPARRVCPVGIDAQMEELFGRAIEQNFVPVVDSRDVFVGIVRRREILERCASTFHASNRQRRVA